MKKDQKWFTKTSTLVIGAILVVVLVGVVVFIGIRRNRTRDVNEIDTAVTTIDEAQNIDPETDFSESDLSRESLGISELENNSDQQTSTEPEQLFDTALEGIESLNELSDSDFEDNNLTLSSLETE